MRVRTQLRTVLLIPVLVCACFGGELGRPFGDACAGSECDATDVADQFTAEEQDSDVDGMDGSSSVDESSDPISSTGDPEDTESSSDPAQSDTHDSAGDSDTSTTVSCDNAMHDGDESDVDCGGSCPGCTLGETCGEGGDCLSMHCEHKICVEPPAGCMSDAECPSAGPCTIGHCANTVCEVLALAEHTACDDANACTRDDACKAGTCVGVDARSFIETFGGGGKGWELVTNHGQEMWEIGPAMPSTCDVAQPRTGEDPAIDATPDHLDPNNGIAGTMIGACTEPVFALSQGCLISPAFPAAHLDGSWLTFAQQRHFEGARGLAFTDPGWHANVRIYDAAAGVNSVVHQVDPSQVGNDTQWMPVAVELPNVKSATTIQIYFCYSNALGGPGEPSLAAGWSIDDILVAPAGCALSGHPLRPRARNN